MPPKIIALTSVHGDQPQTELDSHADSPVVGQNCLVMETLDRTVDVKGFTSSLSTCTVPLVNAALLYTCEYTGEKCIFLVYNALFVPEMEHNLIPPFMMRLAGLEVDEKPKFLSKRLSVENHSFYCPKLKKRIHLKLIGTTSYFPTNIPSSEDLQYIDCRIELTPPSPSWNLHETSYQHWEDNMMDYSGDIRIFPQQHELDLNVVSTETTWPFPLKIFSLTSHKNQDVLTPEELARRWNIDIQAAKMTLDLTTCRLL